MGELQRLCKKMSSICTIKKTTFRLFQCYCGLSVPFSHLMANEIH